MCPVFIFAMQRDSVSKTFAFNFKLSPSHPLRTVDLLFAVAAGVALFTSHVTSLLCHSWNLFFKFKMVHWYLESLLCCISCLEQCYLLTSNFAFLGFVCLRHLFFTFFLMHSYKTYAWTPALINKSSRISENPNPSTWCPQKNTDQSANINFTCFSTKTSC